MASRPVIQAACHCRRVRLEVVLSDGLATARRCDCSYCRMRGAVVVSAEVGGVQVLSGADVLTEYRFNTNTARHYFCSVCGIYTHHQRRSNPHQFGVNAACIEGVSPFDFREVPVNDGVNHPSDKGPGAKSGIAGVLRYEPSQK
jgi:hypothetical protein